MASGLDHKLIFQPFSVSHIGSTFNLYNPPPSAYLAILIESMSVEKKRPPSIESSLIILTMFSSIELY